MFYSSDDASLQFERSGNPGYHIGLPVLFGSLEEDTMYLHAEGLSLSGTLPDGSCAPSQENSGLAPIVLFGHDIFISCYFEFTFD